MRTLWSLECWDGYGWYLVGSHSKLKSARLLRDEYFQGRTTRIQKWVRPPKGK